MQIGAFRKSAGKTLTAKFTKSALKNVSRNTARTQISQAAVALRGDSGRLVQNLGQYLLGLPFSQEMKDESFKTLGDVAYDLVILAKVLKVKTPTSTKKSKLVGTRGAAVLQFDSLTTDILRTAEKGLFSRPSMTTVKKMVTNPSKGGAKEERDVEVVDVTADKAAEADRQKEMQSYLTGAIDVFWRLCYDITGQVPSAILDAKFERMKVEFPNVDFTEAPKAPKAAPKAVKTKGEKATVTA